MRCYIKAFKNYWESDGRTSRKEFLFFYLFHFLAIFIFSFIDGWFGLYSSSLSTNYGYITLAYLLITFCPSICIQIRRLHDSNKSGAWFFLSLVPIACIYVLYLYLKRGDPSINDYGLPPEKQDKNEDLPKGGQEHLLENSSPCPTIKVDISAVEDEPIICYCRKCGTKLTDEGLFCHKCGTKVVKE